MAALGALGVITAAGLVAQLPRHAAPQDGLPARAVQRLGPVPFHHRGMIAIAFRDDDHTIVTLERDHVRSWDVSGRASGSLCLVAAGRDCTDPLTSQPEISAISADGRWAARFDGLAEAIQKQQLVFRVRDAVSGAEIATLSERLDPRRSPPQTLQFSPDGRTLVATGGRYGSYGTHAFEIASGRRVDLAGVPRDLVGAITWSADGRCVATGAADVTVRDTASGDALGIAHAPIVESSTKGGAQVRAASALVIAISPDCRTLAAAYDGGGLRLHDLRTGAVTTVPGIASVTALVMPTPETLVVAGAQPTAVIDVGKGRTRLVLDDRGAPVVAVSSDGRVLATSRDDSIALWDLASGEQIPSGPQPRFPIAAARDGATLVTASADSLWIEDESGARRVALADGLEIGSVALSSDGALLAFSAADVIRVVRTASGALVREVAGDHDGTSLAFSPDGRTLVAGLYHGLHAWDVESGRERLAASEPGLCTNVVFAINRARLLAACHSSIVLVDGVSLKKLETVELEGRGYGYEAAFSPAGDVMVVSGGVARAGDHDLEIWSMTARTGVIRLPSESTALRFSPDGRRFAVGCADGSVHVFDRAGARLAELLGHEAGVESLLWTSSDRLISRSADGTALVWDVPRS